MKVRAIAAVLAMVLALVGTFVLVSYVRGADARALAGTETVEVLVVKDAVPAGTLAEDLPGFLTIADVPANVVLDGVVASLDDLDGTVSTVDLEVGEQLLASRFETPEEIDAQDDIAVPTGMQLVTVLLEPQRVVGGDIEAGSTVGVFVSDLEGKTTHLVLHKALVTNVQGQPAPLEPAEDGTVVTVPVPEGSLLVTLALDAPDAERLVFGMEHGMVWLSDEPSDATEGGTAVLDWTSVYQ